MRKKEEKVEVSRKEYLKSSLIAHLLEVMPESERKFDIYKVCEPLHTRGSFRNFMNGDFYSTDKRLFREIMQELKKEGIFIHVAGKWWARA